MRNQPIMRSCELLAGMFGQPARRAEIRRLRALYASDNDSSSASSEPAQKRRRTEEATSEELVGLWELLFEESFADFEDSDSDEEGVGPLEHSARRYEYGSLDWLWVMMGMEHVFPNSLGRPAGDAAAAARWAAPA